MQPAKREKNQGGVETTVEEGAGGLLLLAAAQETSPRHILLGSPFNSFDSAKTPIVLEAEGKAPAHVRLLERQTASQGSTIVGATQHV
jgi:hypothetical protein